MILLRVQFWPRKSNGNVCWNAEPILWEEQFNDFILAKRAFMEMVPHPCSARDNLTPCNLIGELLYEFGVIEEYGVNGYIKRWHWDWSKVELWEEWGRSQACKDWLASIEAIPSITFNSTLSLIDALLAVKFSNSRGEARRKITEKAVKIDGEKVFDIDLIINRSCLLSLGKKHRIQINILNG